MKVVFGVTRNVKKNCMGFVDEEEYEVSREMKYLNYIDCYLVSTKQNNNILINLICVI